MTGTTATAAFADTSIMIGSEVVLEYSTAEAKPKEAEWKAAGAMKTKSWDFSPNTVTSEADDQGGFTETLITHADLKISGEGEWRKRDKSNSVGINALVALFTTAVKNRNQPRIWVRLKYGQMTIVGKMTITALSSEAATSSIVSFSIELAVGDASTLEITTA